MSTQPAPPPEAPSNLLHVQFKNPEFLSYLSHLQSTGQVSLGRDSSCAKFDPAHPLTEHNVMAYFATSPFFDRRSNNEQIRMQNIANGIQNLTGGMGAKQEEQELKRFTGLEFVLVHSREPTCFVVQKRWRTSPTETTPLAAYYVINDSIYQAPDLYSILATRLQSTVYALRMSLSTQRRARPSFDPRRGHHGRFIVADAPTSMDADSNRTCTTQSTHTHHADDHTPQLEHQQDHIHPPPPAAFTQPQLKKARFD